MGKIYSIKARERFEIMNLLSSGVITERQVAKKLNLSIRQIQRLKKRFILESKTIESLLFHRVHPQINKVPESIAEKVIILKKQGTHRSCQHISELLPPVLSKGEKQWFIEWGKPHLHLSHQTIRNILKQVNLYENIYEKVTPATRFEMENWYRWILPVPEVFVDI
ncbi:MAG: helix-turn-helix domain-containing protein, partial [Candidatus Omnitrophica bacterium]|nr:helix-turn-helix domain-containing protein [Candidatus Omnitrophota bacterium]